MALPTSGSISMSQVKTETGLSSNSIRAYAAYYNLDEPDSMTEFLGLAGTGYTITPNVTSVNEGGTVTWTITTTNLPNGTILYWTNSGTTTGVDFNGGANSGTITINSNTGTLSRTLASDAATEGTETIIIQLRTVSTSGTVVATSVAVSVNDTSLAPTYAIAPNVNSVNEGSSVIFTVTTTNVPNATVLYWTNSGTTTGPDFTDNANSGNVTISGNSATITRALTNDVTSDGSETIILNLRTSAISGPIVATSSTVTVNDTSKAPSYAIAPDKPSVNETDNKTVTWTITTSDVQNGTNLYWINVGSTDGSDFTETNNSGMVTIQNNGASFSKTLIPDNTSEGSETIIIELKTGSTSGTTVATAATVTVDDTSTCPAYGTYISDFCASSGVGQGNWNYWWTVADGNCGTTNILQEAYSETNCGFVRVQATYSVGFDGNGNGVIFINSMSDGSGVGRQFSVNNGATWYDYPANTSVGGLSLGTSYNLAIRDSSNKGRSYLNITTPTFSISPSTTSVNETNNRTVTWTINTTNLQNTSLYWVNAGSTNGDDFTDGINEDFISINNNIATLSKTLRTDKITEGGESIIIILKTGLGGSNLATSNTVNVDDTSKTPTYSISPNTTSANEGDTITWTVNTTDVDNGTVLYITNEGTTNGDDFTDGANQAFVTISSGTGTFSKTLVNDSTSEGQETILMALRINSYSGQIQTYANTVYVNDTSVCPTAGTILYTYCGGTNNWSLIGQIADGFCGSNPSVLEEYAEGGPPGGCGYVRVSATWTTSTGCIENIVMSNGTGQGRQFSVDNGATWYDYTGNNSVCGLSGNVTLIITDSSNKGANYSINITGCPAAGALLSTYCTGTNNWDKWGTYTNGNCGTYNQLIESNSVDCGYSPDNFYLAEKYDCGTCTYQGENIVKTGAGTSLSNGSYYSTDGNYSYRIMYSASPQSYDNDLTYYTYTEGFSCASACANY